MTANTLMNDARQESSPALLRQQRSHVLFVLSNANAGSESDFLDWYRGTYRDAILDMRNVLSVQQYERDEVDVTRGRYAPLPFQYLGLYEVSLDGAQQAENLIECVEMLHEKQAAAGCAASWIYYPSSEKVGRSPSKNPSMITVAFANAIAGQESEFREWYATRHIRHALRIPALVRGQCFERTQFQRSGALEAKFSTIAIYEQEGTPQNIIDSFNLLPRSTFHFPMLDASRFTEWSYRPV